MKTTTFNAYIKKTDPSEVEQWDAVPKPEEKLEPITIRMSKRLLQQVDQASKESRINRASFIRIAVSRSLRYHDQFKHTKNAGISEK